VRTLIVVADDLGYDPEVSRGILEAHADGLVTAASALVDGPWAAEALAAAPPTLALGLHLALPPGAGPPRAADELQRQLRRFRELCGRDPVHLDGHKHAHAPAPILEALLPVAASLGLRVRALDDGMRDRIRGAGARAADHFLGDADLRPCWTPERLLATLEALPPGTSELMCHPGHAPSHVRSSFAAEREVELGSLRDPRAREAVRRAGARLLGSLPA
jgi:chitin disaccharide deacetylase